MRIHVNKDRTRLTAFIAIATMAVLSLAVPLHHVHMVLAALERPELVVAPGDHGTEHADATGHAAHRQGAHGHAGHVARPGAHLHAAHASDESVEPQDENSVHQMPRCPICSTVKVAGAPLPSQGPELAPVDGREAPPALAADLAPSSTLHFRPVQPRAPPIVG